MSKGTLLTAWLLATTAGIMSWSGGGTAAVGKTYHLELTGDDGARFTGSCTLATENGDEVVPLDGEVPFKQDLVGQGLSCKLETEGRVVVDIEHNGSRSRSATSGGTINISLR